MPIIIQPKIIQQGNIKKLIVNRGEPGEKSTFHDQLQHLDYASSGHTGFAGTNVDNIFTQNQTVTGSIFCSNTVEAKLLKASIGVNTNTITSDFVRQSFNTNSVVFQPLVGDGINIIATTGSLKLYVSTHFNPGDKVSIVGGGSIDSVGGDVELIGGNGPTGKGKIKVFGDQINSGSVTIGNTVLQPDPLHVEGDIKSTNNVKAQKFLASVTDSDIISAAGNIKSQGGNVIFSKLGGVDVTLDAPTGTSNHFIGFLPVAAGRSEDVNVRVGFKPQQLYNYNKATLQLNAGDTDTGKYNSALTIQAGGAFGQGEKGGHVIIKSGFGNGDESTAGKYPHGGDIVASGSNVIVVSDKFDTTNSTKTVLSKTGINNPNPDTANFALDVTGKIQATDSIYANWGHSQFIDQPSARLGYPNLRNGVLRFECIDTTNHIEIESNDSILANRKQYLQDKDGKIVLEENGSIYVPQKLHASGAINIKQLDPYAGERDALNVAGGITLSAPTASIRIDSWNGDIIRQTIGPGKCDVADWFIGWKDGLDGAGSYDIARMTLMAGNTTYGKHNSKITIQGGGADGQDEQGGHVVIRGGYGNNDITTAGKYPYGGEVHISGSVVHTIANRIEFSSNASDVSQKIFSGGKVVLGNVSGINSSNNNVEVWGTTNLIGLTQVSGSLKVRDGFYTTNIKTIDVSLSPYFISSSDYIILANSVDGFVELFLPNATTVKGQNIIIKVIDASNGVKVGSVNGLIDDMSNINLANPYSFIHVVSDGNNWHIISQLNI
jgi:hypothetical protein